MELKYILFDMDGVILNSKDSILDATKYTLAQFGKVLNPEDESKIIGPPLMNIYRNIFGFEPEVANQAVQIYRDHYAAVSFQYDKPFDGVEEMLQELLGHDKKLMIATARYSKTAEEVLERIGLLQYFCYVGGTSLDAETGALAVMSKGEVIDHVLKENDIFDRECAIMVGDRGDDIIGAKENKLKSIGATYGFGSEEELVSAGADVLAATPQAISRYIIESYE